MKNTKLKNWTLFTPHESDDDLIAAALAVLEKRMRYHEVQISNPTDTKNFLKLKFSGLEHEVFAILFLDNRHRVIEFETLFRGTIDGASVHPREVVKAALSHNAAAVILAHNHPSGVAEPSEEDIETTECLIEVLGQVNIRVLDHLIIGDGEVVSFAERGELGAGVQS